MTFKKLSQLQDGQMIVIVERGYRDVRFFHKEYLKPQMGWYMLSTGIIHPEQIELPTEDDLNKTLEELKYKYDQQVNAFIKAYAMATGESL